jgi:four helix bundle protein
VPALCLKLVQSLSQTFAHENLEVYRKALAFAAKAVVWTNAWDKKHALVDHLSRATESTVLNLAEAARQRGRPGRLQIADYAVGSSLECAACLDIARIKDLLPEEDYRQAKQALCEVTRMVIGLRKAWCQTLAQEESHPYRTNLQKESLELLFHHERLEVYRAAVAFMEWFVSQPEGKALRHRLLRQIDDAGTSMVLNIAEGNGRFAELDHRRFLRTAECAAVKSAVFLDLCQSNELIQEAEAVAGKEILRRVNLLLAGF